MTIGSMRTRVDTGTHVQPPDARWEVGSFRHLSKFARSEVGLGSQESGQALGNTGSSYFTSGRSALTALIYSLSKTRQGNNRCWVPSYYCPDVLDAISSVQDLMVYEHTPL